MKQIILLSALLITAELASGGVTIGAYNPRLMAENLRHEKVLRELSAQKIRAGRDRDTEALKCPTQNGRPCIRRAQDTYRQRVREIDAARAKENAEHEINVLEIRGAERQERIRKAASRKSSK
jgi:hypothetical protein